MTGLLLLALAGEANAATHKQTQSRRTATSKPHAAPTNHAS